jgi:anti-sigma factor RsiW
MNERPVCHRAEDLVTYLYGEASEVEAKDFSAHLQQCDACRSEFGVFQQVHDSILLWRNEALGSGFSPAAVPVESAIDSTKFVQHERKLSALAALREFFSVSPLWLRAATGFAALLLCVLGVLVVSRSWNRPVRIASSDNEVKYSQQQLDQEVQKQVNEKVAALNVRQNSPKAAEGATPSRSEESASRVSVNRVQPKAPRSRGLNRQEREQLAKDLRLIPRDEEELPFVLADEPNQ